MMNENELNIVICDDELSALQIISGTVEKILQSKNIKAHIDCFQDIHGYMDACKKYKYDLMFLDIVMPEKSGLEVFTDMKPFIGESQIVFITSNEEYVFETLKLGAFGFVRKSHFFEDINPIINRYLETKNNLGKKKIILKTRKDDELLYVSVDIDDIVYFQSEQHDQLLKTSSGKEPIVICSKMKDLEEQLKAYDFLRVHRIFLINMKRVISISKQYLMMDDGSKVDYSASMEKNIKLVFFRLNRLD